MNFVCYLFIFKDDEDTGLQLVETNYHNLDQPKSDAMGMESFSTLSPPEFSGSGSSGDAELTATSASTSEKNRSRKSLNFDSPSPIEISKLIRSLDESKDGFSVSWIFKTTLLFNLISFDLIFCLLSIIYM